MKTVKPKFEKPVNGVGVVKLGKNSFSIDVQYKNEKGKDDNENFSFKRDELPDNLPEGFELKNGKTYFVSVRADGSAINQIRPAKGMFTVKSTGFARNDDDEILVIERKGDYGRYWQIVANLEVQGGDNDGIVYPLYLPLGNENSSGDPVYRFAPDDDGNFTVVGNPDKSKNVATLFDFIQYSGLADVELAFPDSEDVQDVLLVLDKAIRKLKKEFTLLVENGYPKTMTSSDDMEEDAEEVEDEPAPKKSSKKVVEPDDEEDEEPVKPAKRSKPKFEDED